MEQTGRASRRKQLGKAVKQSPLELPDIKGALDTRVTAEIDSADYDVFIQGFTDLIRSRQNSSTVPALALRAMDTFDLRLLISLEPTDTANTLILKPTALLRNIESAVKNDDSNFFLQLNIMSRPIENSSRLAVLK